MIVKRIFNHNKRELSLFADTEVLLIEAVI